MRRKNRDDELAEDQNAKKVKQCHSCECAHVCSKASACHPLNNDLCHPHCTPPMLGPFMAYHSLNNGLCHPHCTPPMLGPFMPSNDKENEQHKLKLNSNPDTNHLAPSNDKENEQHKSELNSNPDTNHLSDKVTKISFRTVTDIPLVSKHDAGTNTTETSSKKPRKPPSSYIFFMQDYRDNLRQLESDSTMSIFDKASDIWKTMTIEEKFPYIQKQMMERIKYERALEAYNAKQETHKTHISDSQKGGIRKITRKIDPVDPSPVYSVTNLTGSGVENGEKSGIYKSTLSNPQCNHNETDRLDESDNFDDGDEDFYHPMDFI